MPRLPTANPAQFIQGAPVLHVRDVEATAAFYRDVLGFTWDFGNRDYAVVWRDNSAVHFVNDDCEPTGVHLFQWVRDVDAYHEELIGRGAAVAAGPTDQPYGIRELSLEDINGVGIVFGQDIEHGDEGTMTPPEARREAGDIALSVLMRFAGHTYAKAIREAVAAAGFDDIPRGGVFVIGAISRTGAQLGEIIGWLGVSKQAGGQLVDSLVLRGYVERSIDEQDRRRLKLSLTERGRAVAGITGGVIEAIDRKLVERVGGEHIEHTRQTLVALIALGHS